MMLTRNNVYLKIPMFEELCFTEELLACEETMAFNNDWGGTVAFPREKWSSFYDNYINNDQRYYYHIYDLSGFPVGEVSTRFDTKYNSYVLNIKVKHEFRNRHYAKDALFVFLDHLFNKCDINKMVDHVATNNVSAIKFLQKMLFTIEKSDNIITLMVLHKSDWNKMMKK